MFASSPTAQAVFFSGPLGGEIPPPPPKKITIIIINFVCFLDVFSPAKAISPLTYISRKNPGRRMCYILNMIRKTHIPPATLQRTLATITFCTQQH